MSLVNFELSPPDKVSPWMDAEGDQVLHWYGLSYGRFYIDLGSDRLLYYSDHAAEHLGADLHGSWPGAVDYQVARLWMDLRTVAAQALRPLPAPLLGYLQEGYTPRQPEGDISESEATLRRWSDQFHLDNAYLCPDSTIWLFRAHSHVHIAWNNVGSTVAGRPAWAATKGVARLIDSRFIGEIQRFHEGFLEAMARQLDASRRSGLMLSGLVDDEKAAQAQRDAEGQPAIPSPSGVGWPSDDDAMAALEASMSA